MRLVKLELLGFKSFCERTVFHFDRGITSIVGPNGCGKSNIVDAVIWTLGERGLRALRIKDMEDVIFHGSNGRKALSIAEVTIFLTDEKNEYSVRRRIFRDGTNEYFINGKPVRLKDVQDFFLGTGVGLNTYAVIEQGRIEAFVQMKPQERKILIDEAGGITRFKEKKEDAARRLEEVRANLERVEDIYREVHSSCKKAEVEWERWKKYMELKEKKRSIERDILLEGYERIKRNYERTDKRLEILKEEINKKREEEKHLEEKLGLKEKELSLNGKAVNELELVLREKEKDVEGKLKEIEYERKELAVITRRQKEVEEKLRKTRERIAFAERELQRLSNEENKLSEELIKRASELEKLNDSITELKATVDRAETDLEEKRTELFGIVSELTEANNRIVEFERIKREREKREKRIKEEKEALESKISFLKKEISILKVKIESNERELIDCEKEFGEMSERLTRLKGQMDEKERLITSLSTKKKAKEDYLKQLGQLTEEKREVQDLKRLFEVLSVNERVETILERYFERELQSYVIEEKKPEAVSQYMKRSGNYIFFTDNGIFEKAENVVTVRFNWVQSPEEALQRILDGEEGIFVAGDTVIDSRGLILKEKRKETIDLKAEKEKMRLKKEIRDLEERLKFHSKEYAEKEAIWKKLQVESKILKDRLESLKKQREDLERQVLTYETLLKETEERLKNIYDPQNVEVEAHIHSDEALSAKLSEERKILSQRKYQVESEINGLKVLLEKKRKLLEQIMEELKRTEIERERKKSTILRIQAEKESKLQELRELKEMESSLALEAEDCKTNIEKANTLIEKLEREYEGLKRECDLKAKRVEELKLGLGLLHEEKEGIVSELKDKRNEIEKINARIDALEKEALLLSEKMNQISHILRSTYDVEPEKIQIESRPLSVLEREKVAIEEEIESLGEINFRAEMEYQEMKERIGFLEKQKEDLRSAMESLRRTISKIDSVSEDIFFETLDRVNEYYKKFINRLFLGGEGYLKYSPDTGGVEMFAQPQGKKITRMEMLSGGEKALASLALLLALIEVNPPPFCFMDEIDAPLDDANLMSILEIIKDLSKKTQIIFITHNRLTMEVSGTVYGITMEEEGVSKVVSVRLI